MEEWRLTRWHAQARLHFLGKIANYAGPNLLGGKEELIEVMAQILEKLDMLKPPRATDLRISTLGKEVIPEDPKKGTFDELTAWDRTDGMRPVPRFPRGRRSADAVVLGVQNVSGEWVAIAAATPSAPCNILPRARRWIWNSLRCRTPKSAENGRSTFRLTPSEQLRERSFKSVGHGFPSAHFVSTSRRPKVSL